MPFITAFFVISLNTTLSIFLSLSIFFSSKNGSVDPENKFKMIWEVDSFSKKYLKEITDVAKNSDKIILATDPDREGEAIAWHVKEFLDEKKILKDKKIERVVFNEITKKAVINAVSYTHLTLPTSVTV